MKYIKTLLFCLSIQILGFAQVINQFNLPVQIDDNGTSIHPSAILDISSDTKGVLFPRTDTSAIGNLNTTAESMIVYNETDQSYYFFNGHKWLALDGNENVKSISDQDKDTGIYADLQESDQDVLDFYIENKQALSIKNNGNDIFTFDLGENRRNTVFGKDSGRELNFNPNDGSGASQNTFFGYKSGELVTTTQSNTFIGSEAGRFSVGGANTFIGNQTGFNNINGNENVFLGNAAGTSNPNGYQNTYLGASSGFLNSTGNQNTFIGFASGQALDGSNNLLAGYFVGNNVNQSDFAILIGNQNSFLGEIRYKSSLIGNSNSRNAFEVQHTVALGDSIFYDGQSSTESVLIGNNAARKTVNTSKEVIIGNQASYQVTDGNDNTIIGYQNSKNGASRIRSTLIGSYNSINAKQIRNTVAVGAYALSEATDAVKNVVIGDEAAFTSTTPSQNVILGPQAGYNIGNGMGNVIIGHRAGFNEVNPSNQLIIHNTGNTSPLIKGDFVDRTLEVNGTMHISDFVKLAPSTTAPQNPDKGTIYYDDNLNKVRVWTGSNWENLN